MKSIQKERYRKHLFGPSKVTKEQLVELNKIVMTCKKCGPLKKCETRPSNSNGYEYLSCKACIKNSIIKSQKKRNKDFLGDYIDKFLFMVEDK